MNRNLELYFSNKLRIVSDTQSSRCTNQAKQKYGVSELEVAELVYALEHFQVYLLGSKVTVYTNHLAPVTSFTPYLKSQTKGMRARWYLWLSQYLPNVTLEHKLGNANRAADALSRAWFLKFYR